MKITAKALFGVCHNVTLQRHAASIIKDATELTQEHIDAIAAELDKSKDFFAVATAEQLDPFALTLALFDGSHPLSDIRKLSAARLDEQKKIESACFELKEIARLVGLSVPDRWLDF